MHAIGVDIGGTKIAAGLVDAAGRVLATTRRDTEPDDVVGIDRAIADVYAELSPRHEVTAMGLAAAGFVSNDRRTILFAPNLAWRGYPLATAVGALVPDGVRIVVENDANAAGWAEFQYGVGRSVTDMLLLTVGTGLGGAVIADGQLIRGRWGLAAEIGHMRVVPQGHYCGCGHEGCWERYASGSALVKAARHALVAHRDRAARLLELCGGKSHHLTGPLITAAAQEGDGLAVEVLTNVGRWIGIGAASMAALLDPELIAIGGGVAEAGDLLLRPAREGFAAHLSARGHRPEARIELAQFGNDAGIIGAADLARR